MAVRTAEARWEGNLREGKGHMHVGSGAFEGNYSFGSRFEEAKGTNPEELIGAAHAGCLSMALSNSLASEGFTPDYVHTTARVHLVKGDNGFEINKIELTTEASVPEITDDKFQELAKKAKENCPVSKALGAVSEISLNATLVE